MSALARAERAGNPQSPDVLTTANFNRGRFDWMHVVMADPKLPASAKTIAAVLVTRFAHHQTGHCAPKDATIAAATGLKADTVYRQLRLLAEAGYIEVLDRQRGSGRYAFRTLAVSESRGQVVPMRPREASEPGCTSVSPQTPL